MDSFLEQKLMESGVVALSLQDACSTNTGVGTQLELVVVFSSESVNHSEHIYENQIPFVFIER